MAYAGETRTKKVARAMAYEMAANALPPHRRGRATVCALAGKGAHDLGPIVAFGLTDRPRDVLLVDRDEDGLEVARAVWPGVRTYCGELDDVIAPWPIDVGVADFCGTVLSRENADGLIRLVRQVNRSGGVIIVTYLRAREGAEVSAIIEQESGPAQTFRNWIVYGGGTWTPDLAASAWKQQRRDLVRFALVHEAVSRAVTGESAFRQTGMKRGWTYVFPVGHVEYFDNHSPMGMAVFQVRRYWPVRFDEAALAAAMARFDASASAPSARPAPEILSRVGPAVLLAHADALEARGIDAARALSESPGRLAAYRAHLTRGTYRRNARQDACQTPSKVEAD